MGFYVTIVYVEVKNREDKLIDFHVCEYCAGEDEADYLNKSSYYPYFLDDLNIYKDRYKNEDYIISLQTRIAKC